MIDQLEARVAQLRNTQEQYFLGLERQPPDKAREALKQEIEGLKPLLGRNTGLKFRAATLLNKFLSYERMWLRTQRDIEEGRYRRDLFKARLRSPQREPAKPELAQPRQEAAGRPAAVEPPPAASAAVASKPPPAPVVGPSDERLQAIYQAYVSAKRQCRESTAGLSFEQIATKLRQQVPGILEQTKARSVDFKVVIKDGKATLRAVAKE